MRRLSQPSRQGWLAIKPIVYAKKNSNLLEKKNWKLLLLLLLRCLILADRL